MGPARNPGSARAAGASHSSAVHGAGCTRLNDRGTPSTSTTAPTPTAKAATIQTQRLRMDLFSSDHALRTQPLAQVVEF